MATNADNKPSEAKGQHAGPDIDKVTGQALTDHEWDGIRELNNPLPRWWLWVFYGSVVFAVVYMILYPSIPLIKDGTTGLLGWNSRAAIARELSEVEAGRQAVMEQIRSLPLEDIRADRELSQIAFRGGQSAFKVNCVQCHGSGAEGGFGYANLNDDDWIWGGTLEEIAATIRHGVRYDQDPDTRISEMPAFGRDGLLDDDQIAAITQFVLSLSGQEHDAAVAETGSQLYVDNCAVCHGESGEGQPMLGAPALNDAVWLYSSEPEVIASQIYNPKHGVMPAWTGRLDEVTIKQLAIYVHGLGGGQSAEEVSAN
ncbi:cytochrome-c oxidase, cbb3-type subunit III [Afifella pfennigii]|uniref:cytochrome-c oxidase, cbb3-type subunit III n=1 Tax=Afifella pfennigii TaxID=209897 RepID=UPI00068BF823|nr:cytochrome-c oxidase, cbb3-type subunit III [Afifella pfennigii]